MARVLQFERPLMDGVRQYVGDRVDALFYQSIDYVEFLAELLGARNSTLVAIDENESVCGVLPMLSLEGRWGCIVNSLPFFGSNGGLLAEPGMHGLLVDRYNAVALSNETAACTLIESPLLPAEGARIAHNQTDKRIGQFTPIRFSDAHEERILTQCHHKTRNMIRKAQKCGIEVTVSNSEIEFLRATHRENIAALGGPPKPDAFFDLLPRRFVADRDYRIYVARREGTPVAALLLFYFSRTVEYYMPVIRKEFRELQPMSLLVYGAMSDASRQGYWWWNWGGTWHNQDGVYRFKSRWGTVDREYTYYVQLNRPEIAGYDRQSILDAYPYFYVLPFGMLTSQAA